MMYNYFNSIDGKNGSCFNTITSSFKYPADSDLYDFILPNFFYNFYIVIINIQLLSKECMGTQFNVPNIT